MNKLDRWKLDAALPSEVKLRMVKFCFLSNFVIWTLIGLALSALEFFVSGEVEVFTVYYVVIFSALYSFVCVYLYAKNMRWCDDWVKTYSNGEKW